MSEIKRGRPSGRKKEERLHVMISKELKEKFQEVAEKDGSNISVKTCELITKYIEDKKIKEEKYE